MFDVIRTFDWSELERLTLVIRVMKSEGATIVSGLDKETGKIYVLHSDLEGRKNDATSI